MTCSKKLHADIAAIRRPAQNAGAVPSFYVRIADNAARKGQCAFARDSLARVKRIIKRYGFPLKGARKRRRRR